MFLAHSSHGPATARPSPRRHADWPAEWVFAAIALTVGTASAFLVPPLLIHDEITHFLRAYEVSEGRLVPGASRDGWAASRLPASIERFLILRSEMAQGKRLSAADFRELAAIRLRPGKRKVFAQHYTVPNCYVAYLPQGAAIAAGRRLGLGPLGLIYAARFGSLAACVAIVALAIRRLPCLKSALTALALTPAAVTLYASTSADPILLALALWVFASLMQWLGGRPLGVSRRVALTLGCVLLGLIKFPYVLLGMIPSFSAVATRAPGRWPLRTAVALAVLGLVPALGWLSYGSRHVPEAFRLGQGPELSRSAQLRYIRAEPLAAAWTLADSAIDQAANNLIHVAEVSCHVTGTTVLVLLAGVGFPFLLAIRDPAEGPALAVRAACGLAFLGAVGLIYLSMYLWWTPAGASAVQGVQPRYFLPLLPLLLAVVQGTSRTAGRADLRWVAVVSSALLTISLVRVGQFYHVGWETPWIGPSASVVIVATAATAAWFLALRPRTATVEGRTTARAVAIPAESITAV